MISPEENQLLKQSGRGTQCGELMRRYWQPAALSEELEPDKPLPVQLFGEELILFRDHQGKPALIGRYCAHQGVDMIYARVERDGIRCMYHGWLFDPCGKVVVKGDWVPGGEQRMSVGQAAYPCVEADGLIFTYMGSGEAPALSVHKFFANSSACFPPTKVLRGENYLEEILHAHESAFDGARFIMPNLVGSQGLSSIAGCSVSWHVPVDDNSHVEFTLRSFGGLTIIGERLDTAEHILLEAIGDITHSEAFRHSQARKISSP